jgi:hypothetical protein
MQQRLWVLVAGLGVICKDTYWLRSKKMIRGPPQVKPMDVIRTDGDRKGGVLCVINTESATGMAERSLPVAVMGLGTVPSPDDKPGGTKPWSLKHG